jgi:hypothetical protein
MFRIFKKNKETEPLDQSLNQMYLPKDVMALVINQLKPNKQLEISRTCKFFHQTVFTLHQDEIVTYKKTQAEIYLDRLVEATRTGIKHYIKNTLGGITGKKRAFFYYALLNSKPCEFFIKNIAAYAIFHHEGGQVLKSCIHTQLTDILNKQNIVNKQVDILEKNILENIMISCFQCSADEIHTFSKLIDNLKYHPDIKPYIKTDSQYDGSTYSIYSYQNDQTMLVQNLERELINIQSALPEQKQNTPKPGG